jgi:hypothetical protein
LLAGNGASAISALSTTTTDTEIETYGMPGNNATAGIFGAAIIDILDYANTSKRKVLRSFSGDDRNGAGWVEFSSGLWMDSSAITSVTLIAGNSTWTANTTFALYGIKVA